MRYALAHNQFSEDYALRRILNVKFVNRLFFRSEISLFSTLFFYFTLLLTRCTSRRWSHQNTLALGSCCCFFTIWLSKFLRPCVSFWHLSSLLCHSTQWIMKQLICCFLFYSQLWCKSCSTHVRFGDRSIYLKVNNSYFIHLHHLLGDHHSPATTNTCQLKTSLTNHWIIKNPPREKKSHQYLPQSKRSREKMWAPTTLLTSHLEYWMSNKKTERDLRRREKKNSHSNEKLLDKTDQSTLRLMKRTPKYYARAQRSHTSQKSTIDRHSVAISKINSKCVHIYFGQARDT